MSSRSPPFIRVDQRSPTPASSLSISPRSTSPLSVRSWKSPIPVRSPSPVLRSPSSPVFSVKSADSVRSMSFSSSSASPRSVSPRSPVRSPKFSSGQSEQKQKFCDCVVKVAAKQPESCNSEKAWFQTREGEKCYNPYAVCAKTTGTTSKQCSVNYSFAQMNDSQLRGYLSLKGLSGSGDRSALVQRAEEYVRSEYK